MVPDMREAFAIIEKKLEAIEEKVETIAEDVNEMKEDIPISLDDDLSEIKSLLIQIT